MKVSITTATLNSRKTIKDCLQSVNNQTYPEIEHIIQDGGSTDGTREIVNQNSGKNIRMYSEPDLGIYDALNKGISHSTGDIIGFLHSDDVFSSPFILEHIMKLFIKNNLDVVYGDLVYVNQGSRNKTIRYWKSKSFSAGLIKRGWMPPHPTVFMKKSVYLQYGLYNSKYKISADYELILRTFLNPKLKIGYIPEVVTRMTIGGKSNKSIKNIITKSSEDYGILKDKRIPFPALVLLLKNLRKLNQFFIRPPQP